MIGGLFQGARFASGGFMAFVGGLSSIMAMVLGIAIGIGVQHLRYEGFPVPWPVTYIWEGGGKIREVEREAARAERLQCEAEKEASRIAAEKFDGEENARRHASMAKQLMEANLRAEEARNDLDAFEKLVAEEDAATPGRETASCRLGPRAAGGLQPRPLPYPSARAP